jgi:hypothetical protein
MIGGDSETTGEVAMAVSSLGSIALGEIGFQLQKRRNFSEGHIAMMQHYGVVGPWTGLASYIATGSDNPNIAGASLLVGGIGGLVIGNSVSKKYDYTRGDATTITSLATIATGIGFTFMAESLEDDNAYESLILIPAAGTIIGTLIAQRSVKGVYLTKKQGSAINLATAGSTLLGLGVTALIESESPSVWIGVPSALALITHQLVFHKYKRENLASSLQGRRPRNRDFTVAFDLMPENYFVNRKLEANPRSQSRFPIANPLINLKIGF